MSEKELYMIEQAQALHEKIREMSVEKRGKKVSVERATLILAGLMAETLLEYEEPDLVMEQSFHRLMTLLGTEPLEGDLPEDFVPVTFMIDEEVEKGRHLAREFSLNLPEEMNDVHEIGVALILNDFPLWTRKGHSCQKSLRLLVEGVITGLTLEMAVQDLCDQVIEEFMGQQYWSVSRVISSLSRLAGRCCVDEQCATDCKDSLMQVMRSEAVRYGSGYHGDWDSAEIANDLTLEADVMALEDLEDSAEEFFEIAGIDDPLFKATALAKAAGRMMAVTGGSHTGCLHPSLAKSLARAAFLDGIKTSA